MADNVTAAAVLMAIVFGILLIDIAHKNASRLFGKGWLVLMIASLALLIAVLALTLT